MENQKHIEAYQDLFEYLRDEHDLILLQSEMDEIIDLSAKAVRKYNEASVGSQQPDTESKCNKHIVSGSLLLEQDNDIDVVGNCPNCGVEFHIHKQ